MSEIENALAQSIKSIAEQDEQLKHLYVQLKDLESISEAYTSSKSALEDAKSNLMRIAEIQKSGSEIQNELFKSLQNLVDAMSQFNGTLIEAGVHEFGNKIESISDLLNQYVIQVDEKASANKSEILQSVETFTNKLKSTIWGATFFLVFAIPAIVLIFQGSN